MRSAMSAIREGPSSTAILARKVRSTSDRSRSAGSWTSEPSRRRAACTPAIAADSVIRTSASPVEGIFAGPVADQLDQERVTAGAPGGDVQRLVGDAVPGLQQGFAQGIGDIGQVHRPEMVTIGPAQKGQHVVI